MAHYFTCTSFDLRNGLCSSWPSSGASCERDGKEIKEEPFKMALHTPLGRRTHLGRSTVIKV